MDPMFPVKEEYLDVGGSWRPPDSVAAQAPRPMEGLHDMGPPAFLTKTYEMVDDLSSDGVVSWSRGGRSFVVWDPRNFAAIVLPRYFKHNNFSSFVRQLNTYGFRKVDPDRWEFANEAFLKGQKQLIRNIRRRKATSSQHVGVTGQVIVPRIDVERFGQDKSRIERLRRDREVLMLEILKLRQQLQNARTYLQEMDLRLKGKEKRQQQMMNFLAKVVSNPEFIHRLLRHKERRKELEEGAMKKREWSIEDGESSQVNGVKIEPLDYGFQVSELEALALEIQGFGRGKPETDEDREELELLGSYGRDLDEGFWEELLSEGFDGDDRNKESKEEKLSGLGDRMGLLSSSSE